MSVVYRKTRERTSQDNPRSLEAERVYLPMSIPSKVDSRSHFRKLVRQKTPQTGRSSAVFDLTENNFGDFIAQGCALVLLVRFQNISNTSLQEAYSNFIIENEGISPGSATDSLLLMRQEIPEAFGLSFVQLASPILIDGKWDHFLVCRDHQGFKTGDSKGAITESTTRLIHYRDLSELVSPIFVFRSVERHALLESLSLSEIGRYYPHILDEIRTGV